MWITCQHRRTVLLYVACHGNLTAGFCSVLQSNWPHKDSVHLLTCDGLVEALIAQDLIHRTPSQVGSTHTPFILDTKIAAYTPDVSTMHNALSERIEPDVSLSAISGLPCSLSQTWGFDDSVREFYFDSHFDSSALYTFLNNFSIPFLPSCPLFSSNVQSNFLISPSPLQPHMEVENILKGFIFFAQSSFTFPPTVFLTVGAIKDNGILS